MCVLFFPFVSFYFSTRFTTIPHTMVPILCVWSLVCFPSPDFLFSHFFLNAFFLLCLIMAYSSKVFLPSLPLSFYSSLSLSLSFSLSVAKMLNIVRSNERRFFKHGTFCRHCTNCSVCNVMKNLLRKTKLSRENSQRIFAIFLLLDNNRLGFFFFSFRKMTVSELLWFDTFSDTVHTCYISLFQSQGRKKKFQ